MTTTSKSWPQKAGGSSTRNLPAVVYFEGDDVAKASIAGIQHFLRLSFNDFAKGRESETVLLTSLERMILEKAHLLRVPNVRVIALSDWRYSDPRTDGVVYLYLPVKTPASLVERAIENAADHIHLLATRRDVNQRLAGTTREIQEISAIGATFAAEHDAEKLLAVILQKCREITRADAGFLYLVESPSAEATDQSLRVLTSKVAQNDSVEIPFRETVRDISDKSVVGHVAATGEAVNIEDAYHLPDGAPYGFNRKFDEETGYRTKSILAAPMRNLKGETIGVVQLINAKRSPEAKLSSVKAVASDTVPFSGRLQDILTALASQAAVALENSRLFTSLQRDREGNS
jgi:hypothetical protein